ncbi:hypothetical protein IFM89_019407 [Coptis chinensis]|uniref:Reverse transcriptase zinc-binding domain-containing protein n=1 Tax=Coptis chinensis TaxID=261450 RepID=A0A835IPB4_9MAGN|nr:hypothetical protein IFM89_019407 [Coptis chinensis]
MVLHMVVHQGTAHGDQENSNNTSLQQDAIERNNEERSTPPCSGGTQHAEISELHKDWGSTSNRWADMAEENLPPDKGDNTAKKRGYMPQWKLQKVSPPKTRLRPGGKSSRLAKLVKRWEPDIIEGHSVFVLTQKLKRLKGALKCWNRNIFGNLDTKVREESEVLETMQKELERNFTDALATDLINQENKVEGLLEQEESFWRQKSKVKWDNDLDKSTKFFHALADMNRNKSYISELRNTEGVILSDQKEIGDFMGNQWKFPNSLKQILNSLGVDLSQLQLPDQHREDRRVWLQSTNGLFSVSSAHEAIKERDNGPLWTKFLWSAEVLPRTHGIGWKILNGAMHTDEKLRARNFQLASRCCICAEVEET